MTPFGACVYSVSFTEIAKNSSKNASLMLTALALPSLSVRCFDTASSVSVQLWSVGTDGQKWT